ncbi:MAG: excisionase family DNA-binding protein [Candidatus Eremiobacteraeota bacterium]|nr:excisionase family DNA-binding protein [Candidatus Eremiobacteraeota bacterium]
MPELLERPSEDVVKAADEALHELKSEETSVFLLIGEKKLQLDPYIANLLVEVFEQLSEGKPVSILPHNAEMTTRQAASILNVSRPYVSKLLKEGKMDFEMRGTHRRIRLEEVMRYKQEQAVRRRDALARMTEIAEELDLPD